MIGLLRDIGAKQDHVVDRIGKLETAVAVDAAMTHEASAKFDARIAALEAVVRTDIKPQTDDLKRLKALGLGFLAIASLGGASAIGVLLWAGDTAISVVRHWLRIS